MNAPLIIFSFVVLLLLNALVDGFIYLSWVTHLKYYGYLKHSLRLFEYACVATFGAFFALYYVFYNEHPFFNIAMGILSYSFMRFGLFDLFLLWITKNDKHGNTSVFDWILAEAPFLDNPVVRLFSAFIGICLLVLFF
jgi:hypothetical protein